ncbi:MAG TPA: hypothetical protein VFD88_07320 [Clostridia bacterium]|nr:hypothetical protein [Clostridia bacterium]
MSQTRSKAAVRGAKGKTKSGRRPPVKVKTASEIPILPIAVGGILVLVAIALIVFNVINTKSATVGPKPAAGIPCDNLEHTQVHYHAALQILYQGAPVAIPTDVGRLTNCFYWLHLHAESPGVIHIESPKNRTFTLGDFFKVWAASKGTPEPLDATHVSTFTLTPDQKLVIYIDHQDDKKGPQLYTGDPASIELTTHEVITLEITPPTVNPPPTFTFQSGL